MSIIPELIYKSNAISTQIAADFFEEINKISPKYIWKRKRLGIAKAIWGGGEGNRMI